MPVEEQALARSRRQGAAGERDGAQWHHAGLQQLSTLARLTTNWCLVLAQPCPPCKLGSWGSLHEQQGLLVEGVYSQLLREGFWEGELEPHTSPPAQAARSYRTVDPLGLG